MSGVQVADEVLELYNKMKVVKSTDVESERIRLAIFFIDLDIKVEKVFRQKDLDDKGDIFKFLQSQLDSTQCRYLLYDCHFETKESSRKEELVYMLWAPGDAPIKARMTYASSNNTMESKMKGAKHKLQVNDMSDVDRQDFAKRLGDVINLEGYPV